MATTGIVCTDEGVVLRQTSTLTNSHTQTNPQVSFIYRLPAETLEDIFIRCARDYFSKQDGRPIPSAPTWVNVSYVSRHWRTVALNCPTLWSYLFITSPRWTKELLARSNEASLKLRVDLPNHDKNRWGRNFLEQTMNHLERIEELCLHLSLSNRNKSFFSKLSSCAPRLRHLQISVDRYSPGWSLMHLDVPSLCTLRLTGCPVWHSLELSGLTTLSLTRVPGQFQHDVAEFLAMLSCMQYLTYLYLAEALASATGFLSSARFYGFQRISLPHLSRLAVIAPLSAVISLLSCVNAPLKTKVVVHCQVEPNFSSFNDYILLCSVLAQRLHMYNDQVPSHLTIRSLVVASTKQGEPTPVDITFRSSEDCRYDSSFISMYRVEWGYPLQILLPFNLSTTTSERDRIMGHVCCPAPLPDIRKLHVLSPPSSPTFWAHLLGCLPNLRYLKLSRGHMPALAPLLSPPPPGYTENVGEHAKRGPNQIFAPELEELELHDIVFGHTAPASPSKDVIQSLRDALSARKGSRSRLTMSRYIAYHDSKDGEFDVTGWREGSRFHKVGRK